LTTDLSRDHKPNLELEKERIIRCGGTVSPYKMNGIPIGPERVWIDSHQHAPGLAMSRSIGDTVAASVGTTSEPEFITQIISANDKFLIIASDGIWEFLSSDESVDLISRYYASNKLEKGLDALFYEARRRF